MFNSGMKEYELYTPNAPTLNDYNEEITTYTDAGTVQLFITLNSANKYNFNDISVMNCAFVAIAPIGVLSKGYVIDNKYEVEYVVGSARNDYAYLKEINTDGRINI